jgi:hypothetical protein
MDAVEGDIDGTTSNSEARFPTPHVLTQRIRRLLDRKYEEKRKAKEEKETQKKLKKDAKDQRKVEKQQAKKQKSAEWSAKERWAVHRMLMQYGLRLADDGSVDWEEMLQLAGLARKKPEGLCQYYKESLPVWRTAISGGPFGKDEKEEEKEGGDESGCGYRNALRILQRVQLMSWLKLYVLSKENYVQVIQERRPYCSIHGWSSVHDLALVRGVDRCGFDWDRIKSLPDSPFNAETTLPKQPFCIRRLEQLCALFTHPKDLIDFQGPRPAMRAAGSRGKARRRGAKKGESDDDEQLDSMDVGSLPTDGTQGRHEDGGENGESSLGKRSREDNTDAGKTIADGNDDKKKTLKSVSKRSKKESGGEKRGRGGAVPVVDEHGELMEPLKLGTVEVLKLGRVVFDHPKYHSDKYIFTLGFESRKLFSSTSNDAVKVWYNSSIVEGPSGPTFVVKCIETGEVFTGPTPSVRIAF